MELLYCHQRLSSDYDLMVYGSLTTIHPLNAFVTHLDTRDPVHIAYTTKCGNCIYCTVRHFIRAQVCIAGEGTVHVKLEILSILLLLSIEIYLLLPDGWGFGGLNFWLNFEYVKHIVCLFVCLPACLFVGETWHGEHMCNIRCTVHIHMYAQLWLLFMCHYRPWKLNHT